MSISDWPPSFDHYRTNPVTSSYLNDGFASETTSDDSRMSASSSLSGNHLLQRHTYSELYAIYRPSIDIIDRYVTPIWYAAGFPGNALAFLVWIRPRMRASSGCFLAALALNDLIFLTLHFIFELQATWDVRVVELPGICQAFPIFFLAAQYLNPMLVLGFSVERYIAICHPFRRPTYCTSSRAIRVIICLATFSLVLHSVQGYFWHYDTGTGVCELRSDVTESGANSLWSIWSWATELIVFGIVPIVIIVLNVAVIAETRRLCVVNTDFRSRTSSSASTMSVLQNGTGLGPPMSTSSQLLNRHCQQMASICLRRNRRRGFCTAATTVMLLAVSFYLIFATLPVTVCYVLHLSFPEGDHSLDDAAVWNDPTWQAHFDYWNVRTIIQELSMSHYACNFYIYLATGKLFRQELRALCSAATAMRRSSYATGGDMSVAGDFFGGSRHVRKYSLNSITQGASARGHETPTAMQLNAVNCVSNHQGKRKGTLRSNESKSSSKSESDTISIGKFFRRSFTPSR